MAACCCWWFIFASAADYDEPYDHDALAVVGDVAAACVAFAAAVVGWEAPLVAVPEAIEYQLSRHQDGSSVLWETVPILSTFWNLSHDVDCLFPSCRPPCWDDGEALATTCCGWKTMNHHALNRHESCSTIAVWIVMVSVELVAY